MYQNYIFDLYGTLIDIHTDEETRGLWKQMAGILARRGARYRPEELQKAYRTFCDEETWKKRRETGSQWPEPDLAVVFRRLYEEAPEKSEHPEKVTKELIQHTADEFRALSMKRFRLYSHAKEVLISLHQRGKKVYLLSNAQRLFTVPELRETGIEDLFDGIAISSDAGIKKPDPAYMEQLLAKQHLVREECLMIGNELDTDMAIAARCGVRGLFLNTYNVPLQEVKNWQERMQEEGIQPDLQMQMSGDIRYVLRMPEETAES
ncbi:MAG: HAD family hydrolase [Lachnospiraceae bacterium]